MRLADTRSFLDILWALDACRNILEVVEDRSDSEEKAYQDVLKARIALAVIISESVSRLLDKGKDVADANTWLTKIEEE